MKTGCIDMMHTVFVDVDGLRIGRSMPAKDGTLDKSVSG
jgi:hypothetical protein